MIQLGDLSSEFLEYSLAGGIEKVKGWLEPGALAATAVLSIRQAQRKVSGSVIEIGVHHGRYFIALCLLRNSAEHALAIDVFEDQHLNVDGSGCGVQDVLLDNLSSHVSSRENINICKADSLTLDAGRVLSEAGAPARIFSVDGSHTSGHALNDLRLAAKVLAPGGIVIVDDIFNTEWPGVYEAVSNFFASYNSQNLVPLIAADNKLFLCHLDFYHDYLGYLKALLRDLYGEAITSDLFGHQAITRQFPSLDLLLSSAAHQHSFGERILQVVSFASGSVPMKYLLHGWAEPEHWGTWSSGAEAMLRVPLVDEIHGRLKLVFHVHAFIHRKRDTISVEVWNLDKKIAKWKFKGSDEPRLCMVEVPAEHTQTEYLDLLFRIDSPRSPLSLGLSFDSRQLGIGMRSIKVLDMVQS